MKLLAIDSSGNQTSIALIFEDEILSCLKTHARMERPNWNILLEAVGINSHIKISDINIFAFGRGPGSYTGIRSLASFMKGLSWTQTKPLIGVSNLQSIAYQALAHVNENSATKINVAIKSDLDEVYFCSYSNDSELEPQEEERVITYEELENSSLLNNVNEIYAGNGWDDSRVKLKSSKTFFNICSEAKSIAELAKIKFNASDTFLPEDANPVYLKDTNYKKIAND